MNLKSLYAKDFLLATVYRRSREIVEKVVFFLTFYLLLVVYVLLLYKVSRAFCSRNCREIFLNEYLTRAYIKTLKAPSGAILRGLNEMGMKF